MSEDDDITEGAQRIAVIVVSMLVFATICVIFSCYRICMEKRLRRNLQQLSSNTEEPVRIFNIVNQTPLQNTSSTTTQESDHQIIFGSATLITSTASIHEDMIRHRPFTALQNGCERQAQGRADTLDINDLIFVPPYSTKDDSLPSYDQAIKNDSDK